MTAKSSIQISAAQGNLITSSTAAGNTALAGAQQLSNALPRKARQPVDHAQQTSRRQQRNICAQTWPVLCDRAGRLLQTKTTALVIE
jgi:hypothetical protein